MDTGALFLLWCFRGGPVPLRDWLEELWGLSLVPWRGMVEWECLVGDLEGAGSGEEGAFAWGDDDGVIWVVRLQGGMWVVCASSVVGGGGVLLVSLAILRDLRESRRVGLL